MVSSVTSESLALISAMRGYASGSTMVGSSLPYSGTVPVKLASARLSDSTSTSSTHQSNFPTSTAWPQLAQLRDGLGCHGAPQLGHGQVRVRSGGLDWAPNCRENSQCSTAKIGSLAPMWVASMSTE